MGKLLQFAQLYISLYRWLTTMTVVSITRFGREFAFKLYLKCIKKKSPDEMSGRYHGL